MSFTAQFVNYFTQVQASEGWDRVLASFARFLAPDQKAHVLDVGCGPGSLVRRLASEVALACGCDADHGMIEQAQQLAHEAGLRNVEFRVGALPDLPYTPDQFDGVTATNVIFLQRNPAVAVKDMARVCKPGGIVAMLNPSPQMNVAAATAHADKHGLVEFNRVSFVNWGNAAEQNHRFSEGQITEMFEVAGLSEIAIEAKIGGLALFAKAKKLTR
ncbi:demethylmenaquinone methyltransferase / 2-methoxy-6-polyprenyl-1,4-benzoquinol methylase [Thermoflexales bacterium]|nr:demethylmenaquinone methyltransferase / 2-methoxy-6-polyprenyl-1,4-benzoquinol methylase [Thermoflexales bacterium]